MVDSDYHAPRTHKGQLINTTKTYAPLLEKDFPQLVSEWQIHPRAYQDLYTPDIKSKVARTDVSIHNQALLIYAILQLNSDPAQVVSRGRLSEADEYLNYLKEHGDIAALRFIPNLLSTLLRLSDVNLPVVPSFSSGLFQYDPKDLTMKPLSDNQLYLIDNEDLLGGLNMAPNHVVVALLGLASLNPTSLPIYYSRLKHPPTVSYSDDNGVKRTTKTSHYGIVFERNNIHINAISPYTGRVVERF